MLAGGRHVAQHQREIAVHEAGLDRRAGREAGRSSARPRGRGRRRCTCRGPRRCGSSTAACPPAPNVQSTTVSPGRSSSSSATSVAITGTCPTSPGYCCERDSATSSTLPSIPPPGTSRPQTPRSRGGRAARRRRCRASSCGVLRAATGGSIIRPCLSSSTSAAPAVQEPRLTWRPCLLKGSSRPSCASVKDSQSSRLYTDQAAVEALGDDHARPRNVRAAWPAG